jgi:hypothetical protein
MITNLNLTIPPKASAGHKAWHPRSRGHRSDRTRRVERGGAALTNTFNMSSCAARKGLALPPTFARPSVETLRMLRSEVFELLQNMHFPCRFFAYLRPEALRD